MSYSREVQKGEAHAEVELPTGRCHLFWRLKLDLFWLVKHDLFKRLKYSLFWLLLLLSHAVVANQFEQHVEQDIELYSQQQNWPSYDKEIILWLPNKITDLPNCQKPIQYHRTAPNGAPIGRVNYAISCLQPVWKMKAYAKVKIWLDIWHAKTDLNKNHVLNEEDLQLQKTAINRSTQRYFTRNYTLINQQTKRRIRAGKIILPRQVQFQRLIERGDEVIIRAGTGDFVVSMKGKALQHGHLNDKIYIKNLSSGKKIQAKIVASGIVETLF